MRRLVSGIHRFQTETFRPMQQLFEDLATGQRPETLFITCSDSRIVPNLLTQTEPGELFILRNAGNLVPPQGSGATGEAATIEYAVAALGVRDIVVCGHSHCGAIKGLLHPESLAGLPAVAGWLAHAATTRRIVDDHYADLDESARLLTAIEENVLVQLDHVRTLPAVASRLVKGDLHLHGWVYHIESGQVTAFDPEAGQFVPVADYRGEQREARRRRRAGTGAVAAADAAPDI